MSNEANIQRILDYLRQHKDQYDLESLRGQLIAVGYDPADVAAAVARLEGQPPAAAPVEPPVEPPAEPPATTETIVLNDVPRVEETSAPAAPSEPVAAPATTETIPISLPPAAAETIPISLPPAAPTGPAAMPPAAATSDHEARIQQLLDYLRQYQSQYDLRALREHLVNAGQDRALVDEALRRLNTAAPARGPATWPFGCLVAIGNVVALVVFLSAIGALASSVNTDTNLIAGLLLGLPVLVLVGELVVGAAMSRGSRARVGKALLFGVLFTFAAAALLVLLVGICIAIVAGQLGG